MYKQKFETNYWTQAVSFILLLLAFSLSGVFFLNVNHWLLNLILKVEN